MQFVYRECPPDPTDGSRKETGFVETSAVCPLCAGAVRFAIPVDSKDRPFLRERLEHYESALKHARMKIDWYKKLLDALLEKGGR